MAQFVETINLTLYHELDKHLLEDEVPSSFINEVSKDPAFSEYPFQMLLKLKKTEQSKKYHPEGSVWNHTMLVVDEAAKVRDISRIRKFSCGLLYYMT